VRTSSPQIGEAEKGNGLRNLEREKEKRGKERKAELFWFSHRHTNGKSARHHHLIIFMHDRELKKLLLETCPVRPGQESRAWSALRSQLYSAQPVRSGWNWLFYPTWRGLAVAVVTLALILITGEFFGGQPLALATADSQSPGIYATAFYSRSAQAQVVWLSGLDPASDKPTYLDPTTVIAGPTGDPNSL
jgi:hypothetical protein